MIHFFIITTSELFTHPASVTQLELFFFFFTQDQIFVKMFIDYFFTILIFFKNCFNKFIDSIFTSKNIYWLGKLIINTNKFVRKTTRNVILIFFWVRTFITFNTLLITLKISINFKWDFYLFKIIFKLNRFSLTDCAPLMLKQTSLYSVNTFLLLKHCKQLLQKHFLF